MSSFIKTSVIGGSLFALSMTVGTAASAATATFNAVDGSGSSYSLGCTDCSLLAFDDTTDSINDGAAGSLMAVGDAFGPINGEKSDRDPSLTGAAAEIAFMSSIAALFGDTYVEGSYQKDDLGPDLFEITVTAGDWILWKTSNYAGVARVSAIGSTSTWTFDGSNGLSHFAKIDVTNGGGGNCDDDVCVPPVPLPAGLPLILAGLGAIGVLRIGKKPS